jgi:chromate reductase, NAD(P)H dehydrogenase (quinone)
MRILTICGSLQARSANRELLGLAAAVAPPGVDVVPFDGLRDLPLFDPDLEEGGPPEPVRAWRRALADVDAVLIASPEYAHSLPGALKNGIDWVVGSGELHRKVVAITAAVAHPGRGRLGLGALAQALRAVDAIIVWDEPTVRGPDAIASVGRIVRALVDAAAPCPSSGGGDCVL